MAEKTKKPKEAGFGGGGKGLGNPFEMGGGDKGATVEYGVHRENLPIAGMTVEQVRTKFRARYDINPQATPSLDGQEAKASDKIKVGQTLRFRHMAGEKGAAGADEPNPIDEDVEPTPDVDPFAVPIYMAGDNKLPPVKGPMDYVLASNGLFLRRKHRFFDSCVQARDWPNELRKVETNLTIHAPKIPQPVIEMVVAVFKEVAKKFDAEAAAVLFYDREQARLTAVIPPQLTYQGWGMKVKYQVPEVREGLSFFGTMHSHVDASAYHSHMDVSDETYQTGLHITLGRLLSKNPPEVSCEWIVDGVRFDIDPVEVIEMYNPKNKFKVTADHLKPIEVKKEKLIGRSTYKNASGFDEGPARRRGKYGEVKPGLTPFEFKY